MAIPPCRRLRKEISMAQLNLRRAAAPVLLFALSLLPASAASAAPKGRAHVRPAVSSGIAGWLKSTVVDVLMKSGIRIDPNGGH